MQKFKEYALQQRLCKDGQSADMEHIIEAGEVFLIGDANGGRWHILATYSLHT
jgi:hypothetical protein